VFINVTEVGLPTSAKRKTKTNIVQANYKGPNSNISQTTVCPNKLRTLFIFYQINK